MKRLFAFALLIVFCRALPAKANTLYARVIEIHDGQSITVENTGRRIEVALVATDAPENDQPYADVARQHLSGFILGKQVTIQYSGLGPGGILIGKVFCDDRDIGLQMIRDGVAWFDRSYENDLSEPERRVYADSEQAARNEHRGIWQDQSPIPPWEWRQARAIKTNREMSILASAAKKSSVDSEASSGKGSRSYPTTSNSSSPSSKEELPKWPIFSPSDNLFSIRMPTGGREFSAEVDVPHGTTIKAHFYGVKHLKIGYVAVWASGPSGDETISTLFDRTVDTLNNFAAAHGLPCEFVPEKDAAMMGYTGRRYKVRGCYFNGALRNYSKIEGKTLKVIFVGVLSEDPNNPAIKDFLESFTINQP